MNIVTLFAIYFIIWWLVLFAVLPWGATSAHETGIDIEPGHAPSAPLRPMILRKLLITTVIAAAILGLGVFLLRSGTLTLDSIPFLPRPTL